MSDNVIELNGKRYDAITGAYLGKGNTPAVPAVRSKGRAIDGVVHRKKIEAPAPVSVSNSQPKTLTAAPARKVLDISAPKKPSKPSAPIAKLASPKLAVAAPKSSKATIQHHIKPHQPQQAKTLMRRSVQKPTVKPKPIIKTQVPATTGNLPAKTIVAKHSVGALDTQRLERAKNAQKATAVKHFQSTKAHTIDRHIPVVAVKPAPPLILPPKVQAATSHSKQNDILAQALAKADSHKQPEHKPKRSRNGNYINIAVIIAAILMIAIGWGYLNRSAISLHFASQQAGFHASLPGYSPTGYKLSGGVKHSGGTISTTYRSGTSSYTITQQSSDWNSQTLLDNTLALSGTHDTIEQNGQTVYIYDKGASASWVNGGVRYDLTGNTNLSSDDIAAIATSL